MRGGNGNDDGGKNLLDRAKAATDNNLFDPVIVQPAEECQNPQLC